MSKIAAPFPGKPSTKQMMDEIARLAADDLNIFLSPYSLQRVNERIASHQAVIATVKYGTADGSPYFNEERQEWRIKVSRVIMLKRITAVVTIKPTGQAGEYVLVVTVWDNPVR